MKKKLFRLMVNMLGFYSKARYSRKAFTGKIDNYYGIYITEPFEVVKIPRPDALEFSSDAKVYEVAVKSKNGIVAYKKFEEDWVLVDAEKAVEILANNIINYEYIASN